MVQPNELTYMEKLIALHRHWRTAESIRARLHRFSIDPSSSSEHLERYAQMLSNFLATCAWYALLYVVVEGYSELPIKDKQIDFLLRDSDRVASLRRFRNALF